MKYYGDKPHPTLESAPEAAFKVPVLTVRELIEKLQEMQDLDSPVGAMFPKITGWVEAVGDVREDEHGMVIIVLNDSHHYGALYDDEVGLQEEFQG